MSVETDKNGVEISVGDSVTLIGKVTGFDGHGHCSVEVISGERQAYMVIAPQTEVERVEVYE